MSESSRKGGGRAVKVRVVECVERGSRVKVGRSGTWLRSDTPIGSVGTLAHVHMIRNLKESLTKCDEQEISSDTFAWPRPLREWLGEQCEARLDESQRQRLAERLGWQTLADFNARVAELCALSLPLGAHEQVVWRGLGGGKFAWPGIEAVEPPISTSSMACNARERSCLQNLSAIGRPPELPSCAGGGARRRWPHRAALLGNVVHCRTLIERSGARADVRDKDEQTPLHLRPFAAEMATDNAQREKLPSRASNASRALTTAAHPSDEWQGQQRPNRIERSRVKRRQCRRARRPSRAAATPRGTPRCARSPADECAQAAVKA